MSLPIGKTKLDGKKHVAEAKACKREPKEENQLEKTNSSNQKRAKMQERKKLND